MGPALNLVLGTKTENLLFDPYRRLHLVIFFLGTAGSFMIGIMLAVSCTERQ
jgi:hypothetical protein